MTTALITIVGLVISTLFSMAYQRIFRYEPDADEEIPAFEELEHEFRFWTFYQIVLLFVCMPIGIVMLWSLVTGLAQLQYNHLNTPETEWLLFDPSWENPAWLLPSMMGGLGIGAIMMTLITSMILKDRTYRFEMWQNQKYGVDSRRVTPWFLGGITFATLALSVIFMDAFVVIRKDSMLINRFSSIGTSEYSYADIERIVASDQYEAPNGNINSEWRFIVKLSDDSTITSLYLPKDLKESEAKELANLLSERSQTPIENVDVLSKSIRNNL